MCVFYVAETVELRKQCASEMVLKNPTGTKLAFKVKTTSPKKYCVKPNTGIVEPGGEMKVMVMMQAHREMPADFNVCKDKFLIQATPSGEKTDMAELFSHPSAEIKETRLRVKYVSSGKSYQEQVVLPPAPANESAEQERSRLHREVSLLQARNKALTNDMNLMMKKGGKSVVKGFTLLHILLTAILAFVLGRYL